MPKYKKGKIKKSKPSEYSRDSMRNMGSMGVITQSEYTAAGAPCTIGKIPHGMKKNDNATDPPRMGSHHGLFRCWLNSMRLATFSAWDNRRREPSGRRSGKLSRLTTRITAASAPTMPQMIPCQNQMRLGW